MSDITGRFCTSLGEFRLNAQFSVPAVGVTALFGQSGSGKTTVLRCIAGLERVGEGYLRVGDECWQDESRRFFRPPHKRPIGYVFQEASLFPHLDVRANLEYGLRRVPPSQRRITMEQAVAWLGLGPLLARDPARLSGGERQRVAIGRALLTSPRLLLMDEPLSALDQRSRREILPYLEGLHAELAIPVIYVSHAADEVARLADHIVLMQAGRVTGAGPLTDMLTRLDLPLAHEEDAKSVFDATVAWHDNEHELTYLRFAGGEIALPLEAVEVGAHARVCIQARDVTLALSLPVNSSVLNSFVARVVEIRPERPGQVMVRLAVAGTPMLARVTRKSVANLALAPGKEVYVQVKGVALVG